MISFWSLILILLFNKALFRERGKADPVASHRSFEYQGLRPSYVARPTMVILPPPRPQAFGDFPPRRTMQPVPALAVDIGGTMAECRSCAPLISVLSRHEPMTCSLPDPASRAHGAGEEPDVPNSSKTSFFHPSNASYFLV